MEFSISSTDRGPLSRRAGTVGWVQGPAEDCISLPWANFHMGINCKREKSTTYQLNPCVLLWKR